MNNPYINMLVKEKAFTDFLIQQKRKDELTFNYYVLKSMKGNYECCFVGYETNINGYFGIHFDKRRNEYYFGTRNRQMESTLSTLTYNQVNELPTMFKTIMQNVINSKRNIAIKRKEWAT